MAPPEEALELLRTGTLARLAVESSGELHLTPLVYAISQERMWVTTSRRSVKGRVWERDSNVSGLVRNGTSSVSFDGSVTRHDVLDPETWAGTFPRAAELLRASAAFTRRNARFFAGYAVDARRIPLAWTPPGRLFAEISLEGGAIVDEGVVSQRWGRRRRAVREQETALFRATPPSRRSAVAGVPRSVVSRLGRSGVAALAVGAGRRPPVVAPASYSLAGGDVLVTVPAALLRLGSGEVRAALEIDAGSNWRAREMVGAFLSGTAEVFVPGQLASGRRSAERTIEGIRTVAAEDILVRLHPRRVTWWEGWSSGTVTRR